MRGPGQRERAAGCVRRLGQESRHLRSAPRATRWPRRNRASRRAPATSRRVLARLHPSRLTRQRSSRPPGSAPPASTPCACDTLEGSADRLPRLMADRRPTKRRHRRWSGRPQRARPRQGWRRPRHCEGTRKASNQRAEPPSRPFRNGLPVARRGKKGIPDIDRYNGTNCLSVKPAASPATLAHL